MPPVPVFAGTPAPVRRNHVSRVKTDAFVRAVERQGLGLDGGEVRRRGAGRRAVRRRDIDRDRVAGVPVPGHGKIEGVGQERRRFGPDCGSVDLPDVGERDAVRGIDIRRRRRGRQDAVRSGGVGRE
jgi:hypothetical protein